MAANSPNAHKYAKYEMVINIYNNNPHFLAGASLDDAESDFYGINLWVFSAGRKFKEKGITFHKYPAMTIQK